MNPLKIGKIQYMEEFAHSEDFARVMANIPMVPVKCELDTAFGVYTLIATSPLFAVVNEGDVIPEYVIGIKQAKGGSIEFNGLQRVAAEGGLMPWEAHGANP